MKPPTIFKQSRSAMFAFAFRRHLMGAVIIGAIFGFYISSSALGVSKVYPTQHELNVMAASLSNNVGLRVLLGMPNQLNSVAGFTAWRSMGILTVFGAIWAIIMAAKAFRGDEEEGRWELFLTGQTTKRKATGNVLAALFGVLAISYFIIAGIVVNIGKSPGINFSIGNSLYLAFASIITIAIFTSFISLLSQVFSDKKQVTKYGSLFLGLSFLVKGIGNSSSNLNWLINVSPLGWVEKLQPLTDPQPQWLIPILLFILICIVSAIYLSGKRDLGEGIVKDTDTAKSKLYLLGSTGAFVLRQNMTSIITWFIVFVLGAFFMGFIAVTADHAFSGSNTATNVLQRIANSSSSAATNLFLGVIFLIFIVILMVMAANFTIGIREDEANGFVDNILVRPVSRTLWLLQRIAVISAVVIVTSISVGIVCYIGAQTQNAGLDFSKLVQAGINMIPSGIFILGIGIFTFGIVPRYTSIIIYSIIAWSFLLDMIGPLLKWSDNILNLSLLYHISLVPAADPDWTSALVISAIGVLGCVVGIIAFNKRDIIGE